MDSVLEILAPIADHFHFVPVNSVRGLSPDSYEVDATSTVYENLADALKVVNRMASPAILTGSLFLLGEAKGIINDLETRSTSQ